MTRWYARPEIGTESAAVRRVNLAAFPTNVEAELVDRLRTDADAWIPELSMVVTDGELDDEVVGFALLTRCRVADRAALALAPVAVLPDRQRRGAGSAVVTAVLSAARNRPENLVVVLGHPEYYPRFGFRPAADLGVTAPIPVPDEAFLALASRPDEPTPRGTVAYPPAFGI